MKQLIACCGIDCENCDARIATLADDNALREETAKKWSAMNNVPITAEMISCIGCRTDGVKYGYCAMCEIRSCVRQKGFDTCGDCEKIDACPTVGPVFEHVPGAKDNLTCKCQCN
ncbi:MAG: DUF3795 domain-containing protein [Rikenellaceae bacterium]|jgi:hypothetical protein|nr:DUF3795 domain-containing protein [Rikenellaceae bacterium]